MKDVYLKAAEIVYNNNNELSCMAIDRVVNGDTSVSVERKKYAAMFNPRGLGIFWASSNIRYDGTRSSRFGYLSREETQMRRVHMLLLAHEMQKTRDL